MERFVVRDVVILPFPYSDLSNTRRRPALVIAELQGDDLIMCQITSQDVQDQYAISLLRGEFESGSLRKDSNIRPNRLFTADSHIIQYRAGKIKSEKRGLKPNGTKSYSKLSKYSNHHPLI